MTFPIRPRAYFGARKKGLTATSISLNDLNRLVANTWDFFNNAGYFVEAFGFDCVDAGFEPGYVGGNVNAYAALLLQASDLWPIEEFCAHWDEDAVFSIIEFLYDHVSKPYTKELHTWNNCGYHYSDFDKDTGREEYRERVNVYLAGYGNGWEVGSAGEILSAPPSGMQKLLDASPPTANEGVLHKIEAATIKFRRHASSANDRQAAVRDLADVLEWLRPQIKTALLKDDEQDLFHIANKFGIRHMNNNQKLQYDKAVWLSWMFYYYLNTINATLHLIKRQT
jgi:hypothetical protein